MIVYKGAMGRIATDAVVGKVFDIVNTIISKKREEAQDTIRKNVEELLIMAQEKLSPISKKVRIYFFILLFFMGINCLALTGIFFVLLFR